MASTRSFSRQVAPDFGLARAGPAGEQRRAVEHDADAAAALHGRAHLAEQVQQEQQRAVRHARQARPEAAAVALLLVLVADGLLDLLPLHAEGRVGEHVVEQLAQQAVVAERVAEHDVADVLAADQHVGLADGVRLGVQLLAEQRQPGLGVQLVQVLARHRQHAAGAGGRVVHGAHHARLGQGVVVLDEQQVHHQPDHLARGEVLTGRLVGELGELADQLLEHQAHLHVVDLGRAAA
jgi:hypothetical protein